MTAHLSYSHSERVYIRFETLGTAIPQLWALPTKTTNSFHRGCCAQVGCFCEAKVTKQDLSLVADKQVASFDIAMHDTLCV